MRLDITQRYRSRLLHDITQVTRERESRGLARRKRGLDEENLTTHLRPCQTCDNTNVFVGLPLIARIALLAEISDEVFLCNRHIIWLLKRNLSDHLTADSSDTLLQATHTRLTRIAVDNSGDDAFLKLELRGLESVVIEFLRDKVTLGDFLFLLLQVARHLYEFHTVKQWARDRIQGVSRSDKEHLAEVVVHV